MQPTREPGGVPGPPLGSRPGHGLPHRRPSVSRSRRSAPCRPPFVILGGTCSCLDGPASPDPARGRSPPARIAHPRGRPIRNGRGRRIKSRIVELKATWAGPGARTAFERPGRAVARRPGLPRRRTLMPTPWSLLPGVRTAPIFAVVPQLRGGTRGLRHLRGRLPAPAGRLRRPFCRLAVRRELNPHYPRPAGEGARACPQEPSLS
jgi:hypothetical protein